MRKFAILFGFMLCVLSLSAQEVKEGRAQVTQPTVVLRAGGNFSMVNIHFREFPNRFQLGGGATIAASYEHPLAPRTVIGAGLGGSFEKVNSLDESYYYRDMMLSSVYAEVYYGFRAERGFFFDLGLQGGYTPPVLSTTNAPYWEGGLKLRRLSRYACKGGNVWLAGRVGYSFGPVELALSLRYGLISQFGEAFPYPMLDYEDESAYRDVLSRHLCVGLSVGYRFGLGK